MDARLFVMSAVVALCVPLSGCNEQGNVVEQRTGCPSYMLPASGEEPEDHADLANRNLTNSEPWRVVVVGECGQYVWNLTRSDGMTWWSAGGEFVMQPPSVGTYGLTLYSRHDDTLVVHHARILIVHATGEGLVFPAATSDVSITIPISCCPKGFKGYAYGGLLPTAGLDGSWVQLRDAAGRVVASGSTQIELDDSEGASTEGWWEGFTFGDFTLFIDRSSPTSPYAAAGVTVYYEATPQLDGVVVKEPGEREPPPGAAG